MFKEKKKVCVDINCKFQGKLQELSKFKKGSRVCRKCDSRKTLEAREVRINKQIMKLVDQKLINIGDLPSANLLFKSCERAIRDCTSKSKPLYRDVSVAWDDPILMMEEIIFKKKDFWEAWKKQSVIYFNSNELSLRASIDRIDESGNYEIDNIQMLSYGENSRKANVKPISVTILENSSDVADVIEYPSVTEAVKQLKINHPIKYLIDSGATYNLSDGRVAIFDSTAKIKK